MPVEKRGVCALSLSLSKMPAVLRKWTPCRSFSSKILQLLDQGNIFHPAFWTYCNVLFIFRYVFYFFLLIPSPLITWFSHVLPVSCRFAVAVWMAGDFPNRDHEKLWNECTVLTHLQIHRVLLNQRQLNTHVGKYTYQKICLGKLRLEKSCLPIVRYDRWCKLIILT